MSFSKIASVSALVLFMFGSSNALGGKFAFLCIVASRD